MKQFSYTAFLFCTITIVWLSCGQQSKKDGLPENITFSEHIAPIIYETCMPCHREGEAGRFPLVTHEDVAKRSKMIAYVTRIKYMPPWPADPNYSSFVNEIYLTDKQIEMIQKWAENDAPLGDTTKLPPPPEFPEGSQLGEPDLVLHFPDTFHIKGNNLDKFLMMKVPYELEQDTFVRAIEFVPDNRKLLHHMNGHLVTYMTGMKKDVTEGDWVVDMDRFGDQHVLYSKIGLLNDDGSYPVLTPSVVNYLPGVRGTAYPKGIGGFKINKTGAFLIKDIHYGPTAIDETDRSKLNIFFDDEPPERPVQEVIMGTLGVSKVEPPLVVPPNTVQTFKTEMRVPRDISILTVNPHMHLLGKKFWAFALKPGGDTIPLIKINDWDFRWQFFYTFKNPVKIPAGSTIRVFGTYDNTINNPDNPFDPPRVVAERDGSMRTSDEMFQFIITYLPYKPGDENIKLEPPALLN